jgi:hypothetical protein
MYKAMKIAAGSNNILPTLIYTSFNVMPLPHINSGCCRCMVFDNSIFFTQKYLWSVKCNSIYEDFASLYLEIWKRVAKEKV